MLVGQPAYQGSRLLTLVKELGLERQVTFTGYVPDDVLVALYNLADVFVCTAIDTTTSSATTLATRSCSPRR